MPAPSSGLTSQKLASWYHIKTTHVVHRHCNSRLSHLPYIKCNEHLENNYKCQQRTEVESDDEERLIVDDVHCAASNVKLRSANPFPNSPAMTPDC